MILANEDFAKRLFDICKEKRISGDYLSWTDFLTALKVVKGQEFTEESNIVVKPNKY